VNPYRRDFLRLLTATIGSGATGKFAFPPAAADNAVSLQLASEGLGLDVRAFGATGDGKTIDTSAVNTAITEAASKGGGIVRFPSGTYLCLSIHLQSFVALQLDPGAVILAAGTPHEGTTSGGYDAGEPNVPWEGFQDFGHNHWHNSLIWGEGIHDIAILGPGLISAKGLSRGNSDADLPIEEQPGVANKAIALKNCHNVILRDFAILGAGHFGVLATGVDNLTVTDLRIDTIRDGMNIDCCRNVRISNCSVNSPWDDAICLKSSFALGYARPTENVTIADCYVTGGYQVGALSDGTWRRFGVDAAERRQEPTGRIKLGTESNGGFKNIAVANCVFESSRGLALECVDGGVMEDISVVGITMRDVHTSPLFLRLGARLRGPAGSRIGSIKRVMIRNITCYGPLSDMPSIIAGVPGHAIEDVTISDVCIEQKGQGTADMAAIEPSERAEMYPEPVMFGPLPAQGFFIRHVRNVEFADVQIIPAAPDARPVFWLDDVDGADFFRIDLSRRGSAAAFQLNAVRALRVFSSRGVSDISLPRVSRQKII
jgi:polygalacturonase